MVINKNKTAHNSLKYKNEKYCYIMLALPIIGFFVFTLYPILWAVHKSFYSYDGIDSHTIYVGFRNYFDILRDGVYWKAWLMNLKIAVFKLPVEALVAFIIANLLMHNTRFSNFYRSVYFMPSIISGAIVGLIFTNLFDYFGVINTYLIKWDLIDKPINWFGDTNSAFIVVYVTTFWMSIGSTILYYMAALSTVPKEIEESAQIDGAGAVRIMFGIKLPMILPTLQVVLLLSINATLHLNEIVLTLTGGAPGGTTHTISSYLASKIIPGFGTVTNLGYASAMSAVASVIFCIVAFSFNKITDKIKSMY